MLPPPGVKQEITALHCIPRQLLHRGENLVEEEVLLVPRLDRFIEVTLEFLVRNLIPLLVLTILLGILLHCVVGEMHEEVGVPLETKEGRGSSNIPLWIPIGLSNSVEAGQQHIVPYVKLAAFIK